MSDGYARVTVRFTEEELEAQARVAAVARYDRAAAACDELRATMARAVAAFGDLGVEAPQVAAIDERRARAVDYDAAAAATRQAIAAAEVAFDGALAPVRARAMTAAAITTESYAASDTAQAERDRRLATRAAAAAADASAQRDEAVGALRADVERIAARLPASAEAATVARVASHVADALGAGTPVEAERAVRGLRITVQEAHRAADRRRANEVALTRMKASLDGLDGGGVPDLRRRLDECDPRRPVPDDLERLVRRAAELARLEREEDFSTKAVADALHELGYAVDGGFATAVASGGAVVDLPRSGRHGLQVRQAAGGLDFEVVRYEAAAATAVDAADDRDAQAAWCDQRDRFADAVGRRGVAISFQRPREPGTQRLQALDRPAGRSAGRDPGREKPRERRQVRSQARGRRP